MSSLEARDGQSEGSLQLQGLSEGRDDRRRMERRSKEKGDDSDEGEGDREGFAPTPASNRKATVKSLRNLLLRKSKNRKSRTFTLSLETRVS